MKNKFGWIVAIVILIILVLALGGYIIYDKFYVQNETIEVDSLTQNEVLEITKELLLKTEKIYTGVAFNELNYDNYLDALDENKCDYGIGCIPINNYKNILINNFSGEGIVDFLEDISSGVYGVIMIDGELYKIDGYSDFVSLKNPSINIISFSNDVIVAEFYEEANIWDEYISKATGKIEIERVNSDYYVKSFSLSNAA